MLTGYKRWFYRGLAALLPTLITLVILIELTSFLNNNFGKYISFGITKTAGWAWKDLCAPNDEEVNAYLKAQGNTPATMSAEAYQRRYDRAAYELRGQNLKELEQSWVMVVIGFTTALILVTILGLFLASFIGKKIWQHLESAMVRVPVVKQIYPYVKQVTDYLFGQKKLDFSQVVAIPYPRKGIWSIGFVTGEAIKSIQQSCPDKKKYVTIFMPTSPTPFTGYVITVAKEETINLPITIDQAFRYLISGGVINPELDLESLEDLESEKPEALSGKIQLETLQ